MAGADIAPLPRLLCLKTQRAPVVVLRAMTRQVEQRAKRNHKNIKDIFFDTDFTGYKDCTDGRKRLCVFLKPITD